MKELKDDTIEINFSADPEFRSRNRRQRQDLETRRGRNENARPAKDDAGPVGALRATLAKLPWPGA